MSDEDFAAVYGETAFVLETHSEDGSLIELCPSGSTKALSRDNAEEYIELYLKAYTKLDSLQFGRLYIAFEDIATRKVLALTTPKIIKRRVCSSAIIDLASFKASTKVNEKIEAMFW